MKECDNPSEYLSHVPEVTTGDLNGLLQAEKSYGDSWKIRGGIGAFMMMARKWDRLEKRVRVMGWDVFRAIEEDTRGEGVIDDIRDLRRYLVLVEAEMLSRGFSRQHRDNSLSEPVPDAYQKYRGKEVINMAKAPKGGKGGKGGKGS